VLPATLSALDACGSKNSALTSILAAALPETRPELATVYHGSAITIQSRDLRR